MASNKIRKRSPRAPSLALDDAIEKAMRAYDADRLHPAPIDVVAQNLGYKSANSGSALSALASLRYYGLLERPKDGFLAATKDLEDYLFAPTPELKQRKLCGFLRSPPLFSDLLDQFPGGLPSDPNLKYELIQRGFAPAAAQAALLVFQRSIEFAGYFSSNDSDEPVDDQDEKAPPSSSLQSEAEEEPSEQRASPRPNGNPEGASKGPGVLEPPNLPPGIPCPGDAIPVRLPRGRRAWLVIPEKFFEADKARLKAQIDLLLTEEDDDDEL